MVPRPCCLPSAGHNEPTFPQATLSSDGVLVTALLATVWHTSVAKKISRCSDGVARKESCTAWRARSFHAVLQGAPPAISTSTRGKGHFIAGPNGCKPVAHTCTPDPLYPLPPACMHVRVTRVTNEGTFPIEAKHPAKTPARTARNSGSPAQPPRAAVRHASSIKHAREKQGERKSAGCSQH